MDYSSYVTRHVGQTYRSCSQSKCTEGFLIESRLHWPKKSYGQCVARLLHDSPVIDHILHNGTCEVSELRIAKKGELLVE